MQLQPREESSSYVEIVMVTSRTEDAYGCMQKKSAAGRHLWSQSCVEQKNVMWMSSKQAHILPALDMFPWIPHHHT